MGPKSNDWYSCKKRRGHKKTHREEGHVLMEAEIRIMQLQARECQGLLAEARREELKIFSLSASRRN